MKFIPARNMNTAMINSAKGFMYPAMFPVSGEKPPVGIVANVVHRESYRGNFAT